MFTLFKRDYMIKKALEILDIQVVDSDIAPVLNRKQN
jgi:hypothetical protein